ncbi:3-phenylpropionate/cinnamic acid dioxygenase subunit beta [Croceicoccus sp. Ery5]|uniref:3-phenylpropionate/cinnamic acid dioxygenase subunit beta n=1 Tax=Croceicoccus sp. Ery5 TaxID=1703340 RepID=UPI001E4AED45|nr:3-phenylpropionate/cinnamic acid dioxygenase subunit beta [Croceicoccus sp. Ery5]
MKIPEQTNRRDHCSVSAELLLEIQQFLYREARLLDNEQYDEWLELLTDDIHYWVPGVQARYRKDEAKFSSERMAYFDDGLEYLKIRVARAKQPSAWAEDPPTRHFHLIGNIEVLPTEDSNEWTVHSVILNHRHRTEDDEMELKARRVDTIRRNSEGLLELARRKVILQETVLQAKNINTFL